MPTEIKEVVEQTHSLDMQHIAPDTGESFFDRRAGRDKFRLSLRTSRTTRSNTGRSQHLWPPAQRLKLRNGLSWVSHHACQNLREIIEHQGNARRREKIGAVRNPKLERAASFNRAQRQIKLR